MFRRRPASTHACRSNLRDVGCLAARLLPTSFLWLAGCDPIYDLDGAFFPAWLGAAIGGVVITLVVRAILVRTRIDDQLPWRGAAYLGLYVMSSISLWLMLYST
jgi:hypothetical protein